jgi:hypothetical protein
MRVADAVWAATALLHRENPNAEDFEVREIVSRAIRENFVGGFRPGLQPHVSWHCVANKKPNGGRYRMLYETIRGRRRLLRGTTGVTPTAMATSDPKRQNFRQHAKRSSIGTTPSTRSGSGSQSLRRLGRTGAQRFPKKANRRSHPPRTPV